MLACVDIFAWESFGKTWLNDIVKDLTLPDVNIYEADYGVLPDLSLTNKRNDIVFTWNGTTSGVKYRMATGYRQSRGINLCDATSAIFAMEMPWPKLDVLLFSWQKVLGGEGAHGMLIMAEQ